MADEKVKEEKAEEKKPVAKEEKTAEKAPEPPKKGDEKKDAKPAEEKAEPPKKEEKDPEGKVEGTKPDEKKADDKPKGEKAGVSEKEEPKPGDKEEKPVETPPQTEEKDKAQEEATPRGPKKPLGIPPSQLLLFGKYDLSEVVVHDAGLARYINLDPVSVPHSGAKHANRPFAKGKVHIVERLVNNMMRTEDVTGKKTKTYNVVNSAFEIIGQKTKKNPVQIFIDAIENCTPREEVTRLRYGGVSVPKAVDTSSSRRLDLAIRNICKGAVSATHKSTTPIEVCLANEIMLAAKGDMNSFAVAKKEEVERIAGSAR